MGQVIKVQFKNRRANCPPQFFSGWIPAELNRSPNPISWTYHVKFKVYETPKSFAVQFSRGIGGKGAAHPPGFSNSSPVYKKDLDKLWRYIFEMLDYYKADTRMVEAAIRDKAV